MNAAFEALTGLTLREPHWLLLALAIPAALLAGRRGAGVLRFSPAPLLRAGGTPLPRTWRLRLLPLPRALAVLGLLAGVLAMARPAHRSTEPVRSEGIDVVLVVDVSSSMTADDMARGRTRLEVAKEAAERFVRGRPDDRIGLLAFARYPDLRCPPTRDHDALVAILRDLEPVAPDGPEDATGIGAAASRAAEVLAQGAAASRVAVLLTDGEENVALAGNPGEIAPAHAAQLAERLRTKVYAVVAGTGRPAPGGAWVRPDTAPVEALARRTGGEMLLAPDAAAMTRVYRRIDALEKTAFEEPRPIWEDHVERFLAAAVALLLLARLLGATVAEVSP